MALELSVVQVSHANYRVSEYRNFREAKIRRVPFCNFLRLYIASVQYTIYMIKYSSHYNIGYRFSLRQKSLKFYSFAFLILCYNFIIIIKLPISSHNLLYSDISCHLLQFLVILKIFFKHITCSFKNKRI